jgi:hypothetical protein
MKKGLILISFAWAVEVIGVAAGFVTAIITTYPDGDLPDSVWKWLWVIPMGMIAVAELGRIPLTSLLFRRHKVVQAVALVGIVVLAGLAFENWLFGFERIVELRLRPVSEVSLVLSRAEADLKNLEEAKKSTAGDDTGRRKELRADLDSVQAKIDAEKDNHLKTLEEIRQTCKMVRESCANPQQDKENQRHAKAIKPLEDQRDDLQRQINILVNSDRGDAKKLDAEIAAAREAVKDAAKLRKEQLSPNQIFRLAAMWYRRGVEEVTDAQFEFVRFWFSVFSAIAVAMAGTVAALVYYAKDRVPGQPVLLGKLVNAGRRYFARKRRKIYRHVIVEPVEKIIYRDGKEPPDIVEKEVVKWIDRIVLIPRWGIKFPVHVNSLLRDEKPNVTEMKKKVI